MAPTQIYNKPLLAPQREIKPHALAHITGGGLLENIPVLPEDALQCSTNPHGICRPSLRGSPKPAASQQKRCTGPLTVAAGMTVIVGPAKAEAAIKLLTEQGLNCWELGRIEAGDGSVTFTSNKRALDVKYWKETSTGTVFANGSASDLNQVHKNVVILISGRGSNMEVFLEANTKVYSTAPS